jgi:hypothetical protein
MFLKRYCYIEQKHGHVLRERKLNYKELRLNSFWE